MTEPAQEGCTPPHDCRITVRCFRESFNFRIDPPYDFAALRSDNSLIDAFFERRQNDPRGGEGGERILSVKERPVFSLHSGRMRGATWFERREPQCVVWLLGAESHDERHKHSGDAYDLFARQESANELFPLGIDYKLLEVSLRIRDTANFEDDAREGAEALLRAAIDSGGGIVGGTLAGVPTRMAVTASDDVVVVAVAVSDRPIIGERSGFEFPLTQERFLLLARIVEDVAGKIAGDSIAEAPTFEFPGGFKEERGFLVAFHKPS